MSKNATRLSTLAAGYQLYARSEGRSPRTIEIVTSSVASLESFLHSQGVPPNAATIGPAEIRAFILYLQEKRCYSEHPYAPPQTRRLSAHTVNCYMRSIRAFWSWLVREGIVDQNPFDVVKVPKAPGKWLKSEREEALALFGLSASVGAAEGGCRVIKQGFGCPGLLQGCTKGLANKVLCGYNRCQEPLGIRITSL